MQILLILFLSYTAGVILTAAPVQTCADLHIGGADSLPIHNNEKAPSAIQMASRPSHLIHPMGEKSIQILKLAGGRYPFWSACVCLFTKEQSRIKKEASGKLLFAVLSREES